MELLIDNKWKEHDSTFFRPRSDSYTTSLEDVGLVIDDRKYKKKNDEYHLKRIQTMLDINGSYTLPPQGKEIIYESVVSARQYFRNKDTGRVVPTQYLDRIRNIHEDPRLCCSGVYAIDETSQLHFMFLLTNQMIYALYGRDLEVIKKGNIYDNQEIEYILNGAGFYSLIPLCRRGIVNPNAELGPLDDIVTLGLGFCLDNVQKVTWYINKEPVHCITTVGYRQEDKYMVLDYGGICQRVAISKLTFGYGHFMFPDFQLPNNYNRSFTYIDTTGGSRVERSSSGLAQLFPSEYYKEVYPNTFGQYVPINVNRAFAIEHATLEANPGYLLFEQGVITFVRRTSLYIRQRLEGGSYISPDINFSGLSILSKGKHSSPEEEGPSEAHSDSDEIEDPSEARSESEELEDPSEADSGSESMKNGYNRGRRIETKVINRRRIRSPSPETGEITYGRSHRRVNQGRVTSSELARVRGGGKNIDYSIPDRIIGTGKIISKYLPEDNQGDIYSKYGRDTDMVQPRGRHIGNNSDKCNVDRRNISGSGRTMPQFNRSEDIISYPYSDIPITDNRSLVTASDSSDSQSLEIIGDSLLPTSHDMCWKCNTRCSSLCCAGQCGSRHCRSGKSDRSTSTRYTPNSRRY
jgi:hypothetical protein